MMLIDEKDKELVFPNIRVAERESCHLGSG
jgi:hypothetical protein